MLETVISKTKSSLELVEIVLNWGIICRLTAPLVRVTAIV